MSTAFVLPSPIADAIVSRIPLLRCGMRQPEVWATLGVKQNDPHLEKLSTRIQKEGWYLNENRVVEVIYDKGRPFTGKSQPMRLIRVQVIQLHSP